MVHNEIEEEDKTEYLESLVIKIQIDPEKDKTLYKHFKEMPSENIQEHALSWIRIGELVSTLIVAEPSETGIERYFKPILGKMDELKVTIDKMKGDFTQSHALGRIGEEILKGQFSGYFAHEGDTFEIVSDEDHKADIHATMQVKKPDGGSDAVPILIETKLYSYSVPTDEVDKFWEDLSGHPRFQVGLFISLTSDITRIRGPIHIEVRNEKLGIFVANHGTDQILHIVAWSLLREMLRVQFNQGISIQTFKKVDMERIANLVKDRLEDIRAQLDKVEEIERSAQKLIPHVTETVGQIHSTAGKLRAGIEKSLDAFHREFNREVVELVIGEQPMLPGWTPDEWVELISSAGEVHTAILEVIRTYLSNFGNKFKLSKSEDNSVIHGYFEDEEEMCFKITWISNKVRITFVPIEGLDFSVYKGEKKKIEKDGCLTLEGIAKKGDLGGFDTEICRKLFREIVDCKDSYIS